MKKQVKVIIVGMGIRSTIYAKESLKYPDKFKIVGVVDVNKKRIETAKKLFNIPDKNCFESVEELITVPKFADAVINGTMDSLHVKTTIPLLKHGYDVLLEKPFAINEEEANELLKCTNETKRVVMICHVLRYSPFYKKIKKVIERGDIGKIINIQMDEQISYYHESASYVRGKFASPKTLGSGIILSKCSHDLDLMAWFMKGNLPKRVSSFGSIIQFKEEMAPENSGRYCLIDCPIEKDCIYSAKKLYIENPQRWAKNVWHDIGIENPTNEDKIKMLSDKNNPFSRCVYHCNLQIVDHQSVLIEFEDGATGTFSVNGGAATSERNIHITGTKGEIIGRFEDESFKIYYINPESKNGIKVKTVNVSKQTNGNVHGNGDEAVILDFINNLRGDKPSKCSTFLSDSIVGHKIAFMAEESRKNNGRIQNY